MLPRMAGKPGIAIVGAGSLGSVLACALRKAGYTIQEIIVRDRAASLAHGRPLARQVGAHLSSTRRSILSAGVTWLCVPDREISACAEMLARDCNWKGKIALHSSGALPSSELQALKVKGAAVASVHPLMTFVRNVQPSLVGVPFALQGDAPAVRLARKIVQDMGGEPFVISKRHKPAYHAWGAFASPLLVAALITAEEVAVTAGMSRKEARRRMQPIVRQTVANYFEQGPAGAFSGPIVRGDAAIIEKHLKILARLPDAKQVYSALARVALKKLAAKNKGELGRILAQG